jgi:tetratricopeptide (TPR) repeat protein
VNAGLALFEQKKFDEATSAFTQALGQSPNEDEARAASYNRACGYIKLNMYDEARDDLIAAVNEYNLKFKVLMNDPDLDAFRTSTQYNEVAAAVKGGRGASTMVNLRAVFVWRFGERRWARVVHHRNASHQGVAGWRGRARHARDRDEFRYQCCRLGGVWIVT